MIGHWLSQIGLVIRLEMRKTFFSRRGLWVYLLALAPVLIFLGHSLSEISNRKERQAMNAAHPISNAALRSITEGMTIEEVVEKVGEPFAKVEFHRPNASFDSYQYTDGDNVFVFGFRNSRLFSVNERDRDTIPKDSVIFAGVFQFFYLRLAIFFGCVGVFTNLFRGEMLDKSLHFYLLTPVQVPGKDTAVLVNRGWIYAPDGTSVDASRWQESTTRFEGYADLLPGNTRTAPDGVLRRDARIARALDYATVSSLLPYPVSPLYLVATAQDTTKPVAQRVERLGTPALDEGPHMSYAIQWFAFAAIALIGAGVVAAHSRTL